MWCFVAFALDDVEALEASLRENPFHYEIIPVANSIAEAYGVSAYPTRLVIDREGKIASRLTGGSAERPEDLRPIIERAVAQ